MSNEACPCLYSPVFFPVNANSSKPSFLITCPKNSSCLFLIVFKILFPVFALCIEECFGYHIKNIYVLYMISEKFFYKTTSMQHSALLLVEQILSSTRFHI